MRVTHNITVDVNVSTFFCVGISFCQDFSFMFMITIKVTLVSSSRYQNFESKTLFAPPRLEWQLKALLHALTTKFLVSSSRPTICNIVTNMKNDTFVVNTNV